MAQFLRPDWLLGTTEFKAQRWIRSAKLVRRSLLPLLVLAAAPLQAQSQSPIELAGRDIALGLADVTQCTRDRSARVGVWPFDPRGIPIPSNNAKAVYEAFLRGFMNAAPDCFDTIDVSSMGEILNRLHPTDWAAGVETLEVLEESLGKVDYLVSGTIFEQGNTPLALFKGTERRTGQIQMRAGPVPIPEELAGGTCSDGALPLDRAIEEISAELIGAASGMTRLAVEGGFFENSNARTEFSAYLEDLLVAGMSKAHRETGGSVTERPQAEGSDVYAQFRGVAVTPRQVEDVVTTLGFAGFDLNPGGDQAAQDHDMADDPAQPVAVEAAGVYRLSFRYWLCEDTARLVVTLRGQAGETHGWVGNIRLRALPAGMALEPPQPVEEADWGAEVDFQLTSPRGPNPTYRPDEPLEAMFRLSESGWLYCFYTASDGEMTQLLPNKFQTRADGHFYEGGKLQLFPDPERLPEPDPFDVTVTGDTYGIEALRCFATSRDVRLDLPAALQGRSFDPIPPQFSTRLKEVFQSVGGTSVATGAMTVTVVE